MDNNKRWPIAPTFQSLRLGCTKDTAGLNNNGIYCIVSLPVFLKGISVT